MQITDIPAQAGGLQSIARDAGISEAQAAADDIVRMAGKLR